MAVGEFLRSCDLFLMGGAVELWQRLLYDYKTDIRGTVLDRVGWIQQKLNNEYRDMFDLVPQVYYRHTSMAVYGDINP